MVVEIIVALILGVHLLCVDLAAAGPLVCLWLDRKEGRGDEEAGRAGRFLLKASLHALLVGTLLGLIAGCFLWNSEYRDQLMRLASRIHFGVWEWLFSVVLLILYRLSWRDATTCCGAKRRLRWLLPLLAGTNLLYHFPPLFLIFSQLNPSGAELTSAEFRARLVDGYVMARTAHFCLAAVAVSGMTLVIYSLKKGGSAETTEQTYLPARWGAQIALAATLLQLPVGIWIILEMGPAASRTVMGGSLVITALFVASLVGALALMHCLSVLAFGGFRRTIAVRAISLMIVVIVLMTLVARQTRQQETAMRPALSDASQVAWLAEGRVTEEELTS
jgi:hypothetical protein